MEASVMLIPPVKQVIGALIFVYGKPTQRYRPGVFLNFKLYDVHSLCVGASLRSEMNAIEVPVKCLIVSLDNFENTLITICSIASSTHYGYIFSLSFE